MSATTTMNARALVAAASNVKSLADAQAIDHAIASLVGGDYRRPLGDRWNNFGMVSYSGDFDHKVIEAVTNAQDAILEREAIKRFPDGRIPYRSPREAAEALLDLEAKDTRERIFVELHKGGDADPRKITISVTDDGCGMSPEQMSATILQLGSLNKSNSFYQQGAFGLGVKSTFRNAQAAVVISRRAPEMGDASDDRVAVAVVTWSEFGKGLGASYLTTADWVDGKNPEAEPWSAPASEVDFPIGTKLILVEYQVKGFHRAFSGDNRAFQAVANTRLHEPVIPFRQISHIVGKPEPRAVYGLAKSLADDPPQLRGRERLPFQVDGVTFQLPIDWWVFPAAAGAAGGRDSRVAIGHVVSFTSSGQIHHHWDKTRFKAVTGFNKVDDRVYVVVRTDELPITTRTRLFTPDRAALLPSEAAIRLEDSVAAALRELDELREINGELQREAIESAVGSRKTRAVAQRISQVFYAKGFATAAGVGGGRGSAPRPGRPKKLTLSAEPTELTGPSVVTVRPEDVRSITFWINAKDSFMEKGIGTFEIECDHPDLGSAELPHSDLLNGRIRVNALIPEEAKLGSYTLTARIPEWMSRAGGLAGPLVHETTLVVTDEPPAPPREPSNSGGASGSGAEVALQWRKNVAGNTAGFVEDVEAQNLAAGDPEYADLAKLGDQKIPTIVLNEDYSELRKYVSSMRGRKGDQAVEDARGRYAAGLGVGLLVMHSDDALKELSEEQHAAISRAQARTALSLLPDFDKLMAQLDAD